MNPTSLSQPCESIDPEDAQAGKLLGTMLSVFFCYTVVTGIYVLWWTWDSIRNSVFQ